MLSAGYIYIHIYTYFLALALSWVFLVLETANMIGSKATPRTVSKEKMTFALCLEDRCLSLKPTLGFLGLVE